MYQVFTMAAGYFLGYCIHTEYGRGLAKKAISAAIRDMGGLEKGIAAAVNKATMPKGRKAEKDETK